MRNAGPALTVLHHGLNAGRVIATRLDPRGLRVAATPRQACAPLLNLQPRDFFERLAQHYLLATLQQVFCASLVAKNRARVQHMESAVRRIEERTGVLTLTRTSLRQEEITGEIEVIMLNTGLPTPNPCEPLR